ncbi:hypothetical protein D3C84_1058770 [compost metagenome]
MVNRLVHLPAEADAEPRERRKQGDLGREIVGEVERQDHAPAGCDQVGTPTQVAVGDRVHLPCQVVALHDFAGREVSGQHFCLLTLGEPAPQPESSAASSRSPSTSSVRA